MTEADRASAQPPPGQGAPGDARARIVMALMELAAEQRWEDIAIAEIARRAGVGLAGFRACFPSKGAALAAFSRMIDQQVLEAVTDDLAGEPARDRLFDVLMRRFDALTPHKQAIRNIREWLRRSPSSAIALNGEILNSMRFMLEAANIDSEGPVGTLKLQGLALAWSGVVDVWLRDDSERLDKTMVALDRALDRGGRLVSRLEDIDRLAAPFKAFAAAVCAGRRSFEARVRERWSDRRHAYGDDHTAP